jgi:cytochrome c1
VSIVQAVAGWRSSIAARGNRPGDHGRLALANVLGIALLAACQASPPPTAKPADSKQATSTAKAESKSAAKTAGSQSGGAAAAPIGGDAAIGKQLFVSKGCVACHKAPGVPEATGVVGPDLRAIGNPSVRPKIAAVLDNTPENLKRFITDPSGTKPGISMPNLNLTDAEATNITAFMETLK